MPPEPLTWRSAEIAQERHICDKPPEVIEVNGRAGNGDVVSTENEWIKAQRFGEQYWLYIVTACKTAPMLHMIQDPASKLRPAEETKIVRYLVDQAECKRVARAGSDN